jgi:hypothetical protein
MGRYVETRAVSAHPKINQFVEKSFDLPFQVRQASLQTIFAMISTNTRGDSFDDFFSGEVK